MNTWKSMVLIAVLGVFLPRGPLHAEMYPAPDGVPADPSEGPAATPPGTSQAGAALGSFLYSGALNIRINQDDTQELQNEQQIVTNPVDPDNLVAVWRDFRLGYRRVGYGASFDGGATWTEGLFDEPTWPWHSDPGLTVDAYGNFFAVILSYDGSFGPNGLFVLRSTDGGVTWDDAVTVVNGVPDVFEDKELIACDRTGGPYDGNLYVAWSRFGYDTDVMVARSVDGGQSFQAPVRINDAGGLQWPVPVVGADGTLYVAWEQSFPTSIRFDRSTDGGVTWGTDRTIAPVSHFSSYINGGITVYSYPAMDADITGGLRDGNLYVAYMTRGAGSDTDIFFRRSTNGGTTWSSAVRINDDAEANGRDQFHPWLTIDESGVISVVFLDRRNDPANYRYDLYMTWSSDGGLTWSENVRISDVSSDPNAGLITAGLLGEYIGVTSSGGRVNALWTDTRNGHQDAFTARVYTRPTVDVRAIPESTVFRPGDDLNYLLRAAETTGGDLDFRGSGLVTLPWGSPFGVGPIDGPASVHLGPFETRALPATRTIPAGTPPGRYYYTLRAETPAGDVIDEDTFEFTVEAP